MAIGDTVWIGMDFLAYWYRHWHHSELQWVNRKHREQPLSALSSFFLKSHKELVRVAHLLVTALSKNSSEVTICSPMVAKGTSACSWSIQEFKPSTSVCRWSKTA